MQDIHIPWEHAIFVTEILKHGDREAAYGKAYPNSKPRSRKPAACRLANRPEIKHIIEEKQNAAIRKGFEAAEAEAAERYKQEFLTISDKRMECADIVRRKARMNKYYKHEGEMKHIEIPVDNPFAILRAIELDTKLEAEYFAKKPKEEKEPKPGKLPPFEPGTWQRFVYLGKEPFEKKDYDPLTDEEYDNLIKASLTDPNIIVTEPILTPQLEKYGCRVERNMETGKYEYVCPGDKVGFREENGETIYYGISEDEEGENGLTTEQSELVNANEKTSNGLTTEQSELVNANEKTSNGLTLVNNDTIQPTDNQTQAKFQETPPNSQFQITNSQHSTPPNSQFQITNSQHPAPPNSQLPIPNSQHPTPPNSQLPIPNSQHPAPPNSQLPIPNSKTTPQLPIPNSQHSTPPNSQPHPPIFYPSTLGTGRREWYP